MAKRPRILIIDADETLAKSVSAALSRENFLCRTVHDGTYAQSEYRQYQPDLIVIDQTVPGFDGYAFIRDVRRSSHLPILIATARSEIFDKVLGLEMGADDYLVKPYDLREFTARIRALLRRAHYEQPGRSAEGQIAEYPGLTVNLDNYSVLLNGERVPMPPRELELLYYLASSPNQVFTREQLLNNIWGYDYVGDTRTVDVHIKRLRRKIPGNDCWSIATVWGIGYKFEYHRSHEKEITHEKNEK